MMGGSGSHEFMAPSAAGEDEVALCDGCGYAANVELARGRAERAPALPTPSAEEVATPDVRTIAEVAAFAQGRSRRLTVKTLSSSGRTGPVLALVRGDHALHERKLAARSGPRAGRPSPRRSAKHLGVAPGLGRAASASAARRIIADESLREGRYVVGANREGFHLPGSTPGQDFAPDGRTCRWPWPARAAHAAASRCAIERVIEVGNIFKLGTKYSVPLGATYLDERGQQQPIVMGSYGIGPARIAAAAVEQRHDADGIVWPWAIAPFHVHLVPVSVKDAGQMAAAEELYRDLRAAGLDVLMDDREERAGGEVQGRRPARGADPGDRRQRPGEGGRGRGAPARHPGGSPGARGRRSSA